MSEPYISPSKDQRSVAELLQVALGEDEDEAWYAISALHFRGTRDIFDAAHLLMASENPLEREVGAAILGQLGVPERSFPEEQFHLLFETLEHEQHPAVIASLCIALGHMADPRAIPRILPFKAYPDNDVRDAVAFALGSWETDETIQAIIELTHDENPQVRDWATFVLGTLYNADTPQIRAVLFERLDDEFEDIQFEGLAGLAKRADERILNRLVHDMVEGKYTDYNELCKGIQAMHQRYTGDPEKLKIALSYCVEEDE